MADRFRGLWVHVPTGPTPPDLARIVMRCAGLTRQRRHHVALVFIVTATALDLGLQQGDGWPVEQVRSPHPGNPSHRATAAPSFGHAVNVTVAMGDEGRWAQAQSILDRVPTESAERRLRRWRQLRVLFVTAVILSATVVAVVAFVLFRGTVEPQSPEVPTWQAVIGFTIAGAGLLLQAFGVVAAWRTNQRLQAWRSPLAPLTRSQRKELLAQVRGLRPIEPPRVRLARILAEQMVSQGALVVAYLGMGIAFIGQWIASPAVWRAVGTIGYGLVLPIAWVYMERDARRARRFLQEHPSPANVGDGSLTP